MLNSNSNDGTKVPTSANADATSSSQTIAKPIVSCRFSFYERQPKKGEHISLVWEDGSDCECIYDGFLDNSILPLPTHWYYVGLLNGS